MKRALVLPLLLLGCSRESDVRVYKVPKLAPPPAAAASDHPDHPGHEAHAQPPAAAPDPAAPSGPASGAPGMGGPGAGGAGMNAPASTALDWKDPAGWKREPGSGMRVASFQLPGGVECTVISLAGSGGGDLANVNRWRGQMGLQDIPSLEGAATPLKTPLGQATVVEFDGAGPQAGRRMVAAMLMDGGTSWFFKMTGPAGAVAKAKPGLLQLMGSLRRA
jgi:hypothetical protein